MKPRRGDIGWNGQGILPRLRKKIKKMCALTTTSNDFGGEVAPQHREPSLSQRILDFVTEYPGVKLIVIEEALGVSRIEVGRTIRELMDQGKIRRDADTREYFLL